MFSNNRDLLCLSKDVLNENECVMLWILFWIKKEPVVLLDIADCLLSSFFAYG